MKPHPQSRTTEVGFANLLRVAREEMKLGLRPKPRLTVDEWADEHRRLSSQVSAIAGKWKTSRVEVARGAMRAVTEPGVETITIMCCTQLMKTSVIENTIGYHAHLNPCPMLLTQPKADAIRTFAKEKLAPMVRATPVLQDLLQDRARGGQDTINYKQFPGGFLALESAGSPTNLAMRAIRITLADEIDKYEMTKEGDPIILLEERTASFGRRALHIRTCSPTWEETSRIYKSYQQSDMRKPYVACPHCDQELFLDFFRHVQWPKGEDGEHFIHQAAIVCEFCGVAWTEAERQQLITTAGAVKWYQTKPFLCCGERQDPETQKLWEWDDTQFAGYAICKSCGQRAIPNHHAGFHANKLYSPFDTIVKLAEKWITSKDDPETKQTFYNTQLGLPFSIQASKSIAPHVLMQRLEDYPATVPAGAGVLTAGIDVQSGGSVNEGRIECEVVAWGKGEESWSIEHKVFTGDPAQPLVWAELDEYLLSGFEYERGGRLAIRAACIDSGGHNTQDVYNFARARVQRNVWAIKGANDRGQWSPVWPAPNKKPERFRTGWRPIIIGVNAGKEAIRNHLRVEKPGAGFAHFPTGRTEEYFGQLTSEQLIVEKKDGFAVRKWTLKKGTANEALDCRVYAYAALQGLLIVRKFNIDRALELLETMHHADEAPIEHGLPMPVPSAPVIDQQSRVHRSSWLR
jgi:phage terminase large subunit GpA-like protein